MNQHYAPDRCAVTHHRNHFPPAVRKALGVLDRVSEGQDVSPWAIARALSLTGDRVGRRTRPDTARVRAFREGAEA